MAFPSTGILYSATGANESPMTGWIDELNGLRRASNQIQGSAAGGNISYWATVQGPKIEMYAPILTRPDDEGSVGFYFGTAPISAVSGYAVTLNRSDDDGDYLSILRYTAGSGTTILQVDQEFSDGDYLGWSIYDYTITLRYRASGGAWTDLGSITDATYSGSNYLAIVITDTTTRLGDIGGGTGLLPAWTDESVKVKGKLEVNWSKDGATWVDESAYLTENPGANWTYKLLMPWQMLGGTQQQDAWTFSTELFNTGDRYSATNTDGALYASISANKGHGIPMRFSMGIDDGTGTFVYTRVFTGIIDKLNVLSTANDRARMDCLDNAHPLMQNRQTTTLYLDDRADEWITTLATLGGVAATSLMAGLRVIPFLWLDDEQLWGEMNKVAHSDGGFVYFNQAGTLVFENAQAWLSETRHNTSQQTFTVSRFKDLALNFSWEDAYNRVICQYQPRAIRGRQVIWTLEESDRKILPGETHTITARYRKPCVATFTPVANSDYRFISATGKDLTGALAPVSVTAYAQRAVITITNNHPDKALTVFSFQLRGIPIDGYPAGQVLMDATDADLGSSAVAPKALSITGNEYLQTPDQAGLIATMLRDRVKKCRLTYSIKGQPGNPARIPGDRVTVVESGSEVNNAAYIVSITSRYSGGAYTMDVEALDAASWFPYSDYFELGVNVLGSPSNKVFY